jgi:ATP-binding cassette subfamily B protein
MQNPPQKRIVALWHLLAGFRPHYFGAVITLAVSAITKTATYYFIAYLIDTVIGEKQYSQLPWVSLAFVGLALFEGVFTFISGRLAAYTAEGIAVRLRNYLFDHIQRLSFTYHDNIKTGDLIQRVTSDVDAVRQFFSAQAIGFGRIVLLFTVNFIAIGTINWRLAFLSVVVIPFLLILSVFFFGIIANRYEAYQEQDGKLSTNLQEHLSGVRVVRAFARQEFEMAKFEAENKEKFNRGVRLLRVHTTYWPLTDILAGGQMIFAFYVGAMMAIELKISAGDYLAFAGMVIWIIWPIRNLGRLIVDMSRAMVSYGRIGEILLEERVDLQIKAGEKGLQVKGDVQFEEVSFGYGDGEKDAPQLALSHINFHIHPGQSLALLGGTGSGKTSLVNLLPRFYEATAGQIWLDHKPLTDYSRHFLRSQIGIVEQEPFLFSRTIRENITYGVGRQVSDAEVIKAAQAAAVHDVILAFPHAYKTIVGEKGVTLSGGQKQRIALARTLLKSPRILILDDATASVDTETEAEIQAALQKYLPGRTTFIITHRAQTAMRADQILVLEKGRIVQRGTHQSLMLEAGMYRQVYTLQSSIEAELEAELGR